MTLVNKEIVNDVCFLEMNNSKKLNCLSDTMCKDLISGIISAYGSGCKAIVISAICKANVWSAGHDINELPRDKSDPLSYGVAMEKLLRAIQNIPIPVIAMATGTVWGGACDMCLSCDMIVSSENSTFAITPAKIGIPYNASGIMHFINQLGINKAREMFFTAEPISATDALNVGLINHVTDIDNLKNLLDEKILNPIRRNSIMSISAIKRQFSTLSNSASSLSADKFEKIQAWRSKVYQSDDYLEGLNSFLEKRKPEYKGTAKDLDILSRQELINFLEIE